MKKILKRTALIILSAAMIISAMPMGTFAMEAMSGSVDWSEFYIVVQPQDVSFNNGESFSLSVKVNAPEGVELSYEWYPKSSIECYKTDTITVAPDDRNYPSLHDMGFYKRDFYCEITATEMSTTGRVLSTKTLTSETATAKIRMTDEESRNHILKTSWTSSRDLFVALNGMTVGLLLPLAPVTYIGCVIYCFSHAIKDVKDSRK